MPKYPVSHFVEAQSGIYDQVVRELSAGKKQSHWMWFIFPQLKGLGRSETSIRFGIADLEHARLYLNHSVLGERLRECTNLILSKSGLSAHQIFGSPDDLKLHSSLTLFSVAAENEQDSKLFRKALNSFYNGEMDPLTIELLGNHLHPS